MKSEGVRKRERRPMKLLLRKRRRSATHWHRDDARYFPANLTPMSSNSTARNHLKAKRARRTALERVTVPINTRDDRSIAVGKDRMAVPRRPWMFALRSCLSAPLHATRTCRRSACILHLFYSQRARAQVHDLPAHRAKLARRRAFVVGIGHPRRELSLEDAARRDAVSRIAPIKVKSRVCHRNPNFKCVAPVWSIVTSKETNVSWNHSASIILLRSYLRYSGPKFWIPRRGDRVSTNFHFLFFFIIFDTITRRLFSAPPSFSSPRDNSRAHEPEVAATGVAASCS